MKIEVTQEDIDQGVRKDCARCPIALAILRHVREDTGVYVESIVFVGDDEFRLPLLAGNFITRFDAGLAAMPFTFDLPIEEFAK